MVKAMVLVGGTGGGVTALKSGASIAGIMDGGKPAGVKWLSYFGFFKEMYNISNSLLNGIFIRKRGYWYDVRNKLKCIGIYFCRCIRHEASDAAVMLGTGANSPTFGNMICPRSLIIGLFMHNNFCAGWC
eukprot:15341098-Ditylum_brightwellii.AAC.1